MMKYACAPSDTGARLRVEAASDSLVFQVAKPFVPETVPRPDRVGRKEAPERTWGNLVVGTLRLAKGNTVLRVRAIEIPGDAALELEAVNPMRQPWSRRRCCRPPKR